MFKFYFNVITLLVFRPLKNTTRLTYLFSQVINLGKLCKSRLTHINHIMQSSGNINNTMI